MTVGAVGVPFSVAPWGPGPGALGGGAGEPGAAGGGRTRRRGGHDRLVHQTRRARRAARRQVAGNADARSQERVRQDDHAGSGQLEADGDQRRQEQALPAPPDQRALALVLRGRARGRLSWHRQCRSTTCSRAPRSRSPTERLGAATSSQPSPASRATTSRANGDLHRNRRQGPPFRCGTTRI